MKKLLVLMFITIYVTGCTSAELTDSLEAANIEINDLTEETASLETQVSGFEGDISVLEEEVLELETTIETIEADRDLLNSQLTEVQEELLITNETIIALETELEEEPDEVVSENKSYTQTGVLTGRYDGQKVMEAAYDILYALKNDDMAILASYVLPVNGLNLAPSQNFDWNNTVELSPTEIINMATDTTIRNWGNEQVTNAPINMTIADYFDAYVYDEEYVGSIYIGQNVIVSTPNVPNTVYQTNGTYFVEFMIPDFYTTNTASEWRSITMIFVVEDISPTLIAFVHGY